MARITVEDCIKLVPNRFELVLYAAKRARDLSSGASLTLPKNCDKNTVIALREIAEQTVSPKTMEIMLIEDMKKIQRCFEKQEEYRNYGDKEKNDY